MVSLHLTPTPVHPHAADLRSPVSISLTHSESYYAQLARSANATYLSHLNPPKYAGRHRKPPAVKPAVKPTVKPQAPAYTPSAGSAAEYQRMAWDLMAQYGWQNQVQYSCLVDLWDRESSWNPDAEEPTSGAYGIPQSLPADKMAMFGSDYLTDPTTQIKWGLWYIKAVYGDPCNAWVHDYSIGWY